MSANVTRKHKVGQSGPLLIADQSEVPGCELRLFLGERARQLADQAEQGLPIEPRALLLLVNVVREILALEKAA